MINWYMNLNYPIQALIASLFTWGITSLGAAVVFLFKKVNKNTMDAMLGLSAGVMLAATFWSLLSPALEMAENLKLISWLIVSLPLRREGMSPQKAFFFGMLSGIVEPISAVVGAILVIKVQVLLPILLSFAGGAMIYVVVQELIPESQTNKKKDLMALFTIFGFLLMMIFDVSLG